MVDARWRWRPWASSLYFLFFLWELVTRFDFESNGERVGEKIPFVSFFRKWKAIP